MRAAILTALIIVLVVPTAKAVDTLVCGYFLIPIMVNYSLDYIIYYDCYLQTTADPLPTSPPLAPWPDPVPTPPPTVPPSHPIIRPTVSIREVNTIDPRQVFVTAAVSSPDENNPAITVFLEVDGATTDLASITWGNAIYPLRIGYISAYGDGSHLIRARACTASEVCGSATAQMTRYTPSPAIDGATMSVTWREPDEGADELGPAPITRSADYGHELRAFYRTTQFNVSETGGNSAVQLLSGIVTVSRGASPDALWNALVTVGGRGTFATSPSYPPMNCSACTSRQQEFNAMFAIASRVDDAINSFIVDGYAAAGSNMSLGVSLP